MSQEERKAAIEYAEKWDIQSTFEDALTNLIMAHPDDPMGFLYAQILNRAAAPTIERIFGREVLNSQGNPTLEVEVWGRVYGKPEYLACAQAPSCEGCPDEDAYVVVDTAAARYHSRGSRQAVSFVATSLQSVLQGKEFYDQKALDSAISTIDNSPNFRSIGVNTAIAVSAAIATAGAVVSHIPLFVHLSRNLTNRTSFTLPRPCFVFSHVSSGPISTVYLLPSPTAPIEDQIRVISEIYMHHESATHAPLMNDGAFLIESDQLEDVIATIEIAVSGGGHTLGDDVFIGFKGREGATLQFWLEALDNSSVIAYIEDPLPNTDASSWQKILTTCGEKTIVTMEKGLSSRVERISPELECTGVVIKPVQVGTLLKAYQSAEQAEKCSKRIVMATSESDTSDTWICDFAVATGASILRMGPPAKGENVQKLNRLLEISRELENDYTQ